jgi:hypothetical protein
MCDCFDYKTLSVINPISGHASFISFVLYTKKAFQPSLGLETA